MTDHNEIRSKAINIMANAMLHNMANLDLSNEEYFKNDAAVALEALGAAGFKIFAPDETQGQFHIGNLAGTPE